MSKNKGRNSTQKRKLKERLFKIYGSNCIYCGRGLDMQSATLEHVTPLSEGGSWNITNLRLACEPCNFDRGVLSFKKYQNKIRKRGLKNEVSV